jgi:hypothetical protein
MTLALTLPSSPCHDQKLLNFVQCYSWSWVISSYFFHTARIETLCAWKSGWVWGPYCAVTGLYCSLMSVLGQLSLYHRLQACSCTLLYWCPISSVDSQRRRKDYERQGQHHCPPLAPAALGQKGQPPPLTPVPALLLIANFLTTWGKQHERNTWLSDSSQNLGAHLVPYSLNRPLNILITYIYLE